MTKSPLDPANAAAGDVGTAMLQVDRRLRQLHNDDRPEPSEALRAAEPDRVVEGFCTLVFLLMKWLSDACAEGARDVSAEVIPYTLKSLGEMTRSVEREAIPTMGAMLVACTLDLSPTLWRAQYGPWTMGELTALEATAVLLAEQVNCWAGDPGFTGRMIMDALAAVARGDGR